MNQNQRKGYQLVYVKESLKPKPSDSPTLPTESIISKHTEFYIGELYNELFPLDLFTQISEEAVDVYQAGFIAIGHTLQSGGFSA